MEVLCVRLRACRMLLEKASQDLAAQRRRHPWALFHLLGGIVMERRDCYPRFLLFG